MDFVHARLTDGRWFRVLAAVDQFTRECLLRHADLSMTGVKVAAALEPVVRKRGKPQSITCDNGSDVREQLRCWQKDSNHLRPHSSLDDRTPNEFAQIWDKRSFALNNPDKAFAYAPQGYPDGALTRGLDRPAQRPGPLAMRAKLPPRLHPLAVAN